MMTTVPPSDYSMILQQVRAWPSELRLSLAEALLQSLHSDLESNGNRGVPVERIRGIAAGNSPPPDDETIRKWIEEHRLEKYG
jgi:hypothetical protein